MMRTVIFAPHRWQLPLDRPNGSASPQELPDRITPERKAATISSRFYWDRASLSRTAVARHLARRADELHSGPTSLARRGEPAAVLRAAAWRPPTVARCPRPW